MESSLMFPGCPAYLDRAGGERCGLPAEVLCRFIMRSTGGLLESAMIRCPAGHWFTGPLESLTLTTELGRAAALPAITQAAAAAPARPRAAPDAGGGKDANNEMTRRAQRWLRRVRGWWPDRNPLRRRCDRAEAALVTVLVAVFLAGSPLMALAAGRWAHDSGPRTGYAQRAGWHQVPAVLRTATIQRWAPSPATAWARWTAPGGARHTGQVLAPAGLAAGAVVPVWVDAAGRLAGPPAQPARHDSRAAADGVVAVLILAELLWGAGVAAHGVADRRRLAAWGAEWRAIGPTWGGHA